MSSLSLPTSGTRDTHPPWDTLATTETWGNGIGHLKVFLKWLWIKTVPFKCQSSSHHGEPCLQVHGIIIFLNMNVNVDLKTCRQYWQLLCHAKYCFVTQVKLYLHFQAAVWLLHNAACLLLFLLFFFFNWRIIAFQCCDGFCCTSTWINHNHIHSLRNETVWSKVSLPWVLLPSSDTY